MAYATLSQVRSFVSPGFGECDPTKVTGAVNQIRQHFFSWYQKLALFLDVSECFRVQQFEGYRGVTLPRDYQNVEAMWHNDCPVELNSSWREFQIGMAPECSSRLAKYDLATLVPTFADVTPSHPAKLILSGTNPADIGKRVVIRGRASTGQPISWEARIGSDSQMSGWEFSAINAAGGVVKERTTGRVILSDEHGRMLGIYDPDETVPAYKRIKITGLQAGCDVVNIRGARRYFPLFGDDDTVETDHEVAWDAMARFLQLFRKTSKDNSETRSQKEYYDTAFNLLMGDKSREVSKSTQAAVTIASPQLGGNPRLSRFSRF